MNFYLASIIKKLRNKYNVEIFYDYNVEMFDYIFLIVVDGRKFRIAISRERDIHVEEILNLFILTKLGKEIH